MTIFQELFSAVKLFVIGIPGRVRRYASRSLVITRGIQSVLEGPIGTALMAIIPGEWDDVARQAMLAWIKQALPYLETVDKCKELEDPLQMLQCWVEQIRTYPAYTQKKLLMALAQLLTALQDGKKLKQRLYDTYTQAIFTHEKQPK